jgi:hypothetical protein
MPSTKIQSFDANSLALIEDLCNSTWDIFELRYPFRDLNKAQRIRRHWQNTKTPVAAAPTPLSGLVLVSLSINRPLKGMP